LEIAPDGKTNYVIAAGVDELDMYGDHSLDHYVQECIDKNRNVLVFRR